MISNLREWSYQTTSHGLPHFMLAKKLYQKLIWLVLIALSIALCAFMISKTVNQYFGYEAVSKLTVVEQKELIFPVISICNVNPFSSSRARRYIGDYYTSTYNLTELSTYEQLAGYIRQGVVRSDTDWLFYQTFDEQFDAKLRRVLGLSIDRMLLACSFDNEPCNASDFKWYYHPTNGNCFKFNSVPANKDVGLKKVRAEGRGLRIEMLVGLPDTYYQFFYQKSYKGQLEVVICIDK